MIMTPRARRFTVRWTMRAHQEDAGSISGHVVNISISGFRFLAPISYDTGELLDMEVNLGEGVVVPCTVEVVGERPSLPGWYGYGARIERIDPRDEMVLGRALLAVCRQQMDEEETRPAPERAV